MTKSQTVHTRVTQDIKERADRIFSSLGLTTSQAVNLFLTATVNRNGFPFELTLPSQEEEDLEFVRAFVTVDGVPPTPEMEKIIRLYSRGDIDYETAKFAMGRLFQ